MLDRAPRGLRSDAGSTADHRLPRSVGHCVTLSDGRRINAAEYGQRSAVPVLYLHGFVGSRFEPAAVGDLGANILAIDRPGYGGSSASSHPSLRAFGVDVRTFLDRLGIERVGIVAVSAGGPYGIAVASALGDRVAGLVLACAVADPTRIREGGGAVRIFDRVRRNRTLMHVVLPRLLAQARRHGLDPRFIRHVLAGDRGRFDARIDRAVLAHGLLTSLRAGLEHGLTGLLADVDTLTRPWDVDPRTIVSPSLVMHGTADEVVPPSHGAWYARQLRDARWEPRPGLGHVSLVTNEVHRLIDFSRTGEV